MPDPFAVSASTRQDRRVHTHSGEWQWTTGQISKVSFGTEHSTWHEQCASDAVSIVRRPIRLALFTLSSPSATFDVQTPMGSERTHRSSKESHNVGHGQAGSQG